MPATPINVDCFYAIWRELLFFTNTELRLVPDVPTAAKITQLPTAEVGKIHQAVWKSNQLRGDFIERNPANLSGEDSLTVAHWNHRRTGKFFLLRHLKSHSIFIDDRSPAQVYAVHGLYSPLAEVSSPYLPVLVEVVLLPFEDRIIDDGFLIPHNVTFGSGIRGDLNDIYRDAKVRRGSHPAAASRAAQPRRSSGSHANHQRQGSVRVPHLFVSRRFEHPGRRARNRRCRGPC